MLFNHKKINTVLAVLAIICFSLTVAVAQETAKEQIRIKIKVDNDGEVTEIDETFEDLNDPRLKELLGKDVQIFSNRKNTNCVIDANCDAACIAKCEKADKCIKPNDCNKNCSEKDFRRMRAFEDDGSKKYKLKIYETDEAKVESFVAQVEALAKQNGMNVAILKAEPRRNMRTKRYGFTNGANFDFDWNSADNQAFKTQKSKKAVMGINIANDEKGVKVMSLTSGFGAEEAGIQAGDVITNLEGFSVGNIEELLNILKEKQAGERVSVGFIRNGNMKTAKVTLKEMAVKNYGMQENPKGCCSEEERALGCPNGYDLKRLERKLENYDWDKVERKLERFGDKFENLGAQIEKEVQIIIGNSGNDIEKTIEVFVEDLFGDNDYNANNNQTNEDYDYFDNSNNSNVNENVINEISPNADLQRMNSSDLQDLQIYPNPSNGDLTLKFNTPFLSQIAILVYDLNGKIVYDAELQDFAGNFYGNIDLNNEPKGTYILEIVRNGKKINEKIILQ